jgi:hypothetical protein
MQEVKRNIAGFVIIPPMPPLRGNDWDWSGAGNDGPAFGSYREIAEEYQTFVDVEDYAKRRYEKLTTQFALCACAKDYAKRCWKTYSSILLIAHGRPRFEASIPEIAALSHQSDRSCQRALCDLTTDKWVNVRKKFNAATGENYISEFTLPHLLPAHAFRG